MSRERLMRDAAVAAETSSPAAHVAVLLATYADDRGECWPGLARLASDARKSERQVAAALAELVQRGLIERQRRGPGRTTLTRLLDEALTCGQPQPNDLRPASAQDMRPASAQDMRPASAQAPDLRPASAQDMRPASGKSCGQPHVEHPEEHPEQLNPPFPPEGATPSGSSPGEELPPPPPKGARGRDRERWKNEQVRPFAERHFPDIPDGERVGLVCHGLSQLEGNRQEPTLDSLRPLVERWATTTAREVAAACVG